MLLVLPGACAPTAPTNIEDMLVYGFVHYEADLNQAGVDKALDGISTAISTMHSAAEEMEAYLLAR